MDGLKSRKKQKKEFTPKYDDYSYPLLKHVLGDESLKNKFEEISTYITNSDFFKEIGSKPKRSFLFVGEPGTGKTFSVKALRNELFWSNKKEVCYYPYSIGTHGTSYINEGATNLQEFFDIGRKMANRGYPVIYQFDEINNIMGKRNSSQNHKEDNKLLECLMVNLQEINTYSKNEFFFGMTNFREALDEAAIRNGRIDDIIEFPLPSIETLKETYRSKVNNINKKHSNKFPYYSKKLIFRVNYDKISGESEGFNFADVDKVTEDVLRKLAFKFLKSNVGDRKELSRLTTRHFLEEIHSIKKERYSSKKNIGFK